MVVRDVVYSLLFTFYWRRGTAYYVLCLLLHSLPVLFMSTGECLLLLKQKGGRGEAVREGSLSGVTDKWQETNRKPVPWLVFVRSLGAGAAAAILEIQLCTKIAPLLISLSR